MSRSLILRHNVINQIIDDMNRGHLLSPLPSQSALAEMYNISRTTVRHILRHLNECGVLTQSGSNYIIVRKPGHHDGFVCNSAPLTEQHKVFEQAFFTQINHRQLLPGDTFSELQLAQTTGVSPVVVREYLLKFSRYNLIRSDKRGQWIMNQFDQAYAEQLFELREMLETHSIQRFLNLPDSDIRWKKALALLNLHRSLRDNINYNYRKFSVLDRDFHNLLISAAENVFFDQSMEIISVIFHFHYQWDESNLKQRNIIAVNEHMTILSALICRDDLGATTALRQHLQTARQSMIHSINSTKNQP